MSGRHRPRHITIQHAHSAHHRGVNQAVAVLLTRAVGTMPTAYSFVALALLGLLGILGILPPVALVLVAWFSQTFLQLVLLPVLSVGQNVLSTHAEMQSREQYETTQQTYADTEEIKKRLTAIEMLLRERSKR